MQNCRQIKMIGRMLAFLGAAALVTLTGCTSIGPPVVHPQTGDGNVYSSLFHQTIVSAGIPLKVPDDARFVLGWENGVLYVAKDGKIYNAYKNLLAFENIVIPESAVLAFPLHSKYTVFLDKDGYLYHSDTMEVLKHYNMEDETMVEFPKLPEGVRFVFQGNKEIFYVNRDGGVFNAFSNSSMLDKNSKAVTVPADTDAVISAGRDNQVLYMGQKGEWYSTEDSEPIKGMYVPENIKHIFVAFNQVCYVNPAKADFQGKIDKQRNGFVYEASSHLEWGYTAEQDGKKEFIPFTIPEDALHVLTADNTLIYHGSDGKVYTAGDHKPMEDVIIPVDARFITESEVGSGVTYVGSDGNIYDALDGAMISAVADEKSEFKGIFIREKTITSSYTVTNEAGEEEEKEVSISGGGSIKTIPKDARDFFGAVLYKTPTFMYVKGQYLYNAMSQQEPSPIFSKEEFPAGWNVTIPKNARQVIYSENLSDSGTDFYFINNSDGCIYDIVFQTRMQVKGVPYYIPEHAEFIVATQSGDILYTVDIPEAESK